MDVGSGCRSAGGAGVMAPGNGTAGQASLRLSAQATCRQLAGSVRPIADVLLDAVRRVGTVDPESSCEAQGLLNLDDDYHADRDLKREPFRIEDLVAAATLGVAFEADRPALAALQDPDVVTVIEVRDPDQITPIIRILRRHVLPQAVHEGDLKTGKPQPDAAAVIFLDPAAAETSWPKRDPRARLMRAAGMGCALVGVGASPGDGLPEELVKLADRRIVVPTPDRGAMVAVIEAATGRRLPQPPGNPVKGLTSRVLALAVRPDLSPERCVERTLRLLRASDSTARSPKLSEMAGMGKAQEIGLRLAADLKAAANGELSFDKLPRGVLLTSPPGLGKTYWAKGLAAEAGVHFISTSFAQWMGKEGHLGDVLKGIRRVFSEARVNAPAVIFCDEVDSIPPRHAAGNERWDAWWTAVTNCVIESLDSFDSGGDGVLFIGACNAPAAALDSALIRSGRLELHIEIPAPGVRDLEGIFRAHLGGDLPNADLHALAVAAMGRTGADVARYVRNARSDARHRKVELTERILVEMVQGESIMPESVRRVASVHEAGHCVVTKALGVAEPQALSVNSKGGFIDNGSVGIREETRELFESMIAAVLAGRAAQEIVFGRNSITAGAGGPVGCDLSRATQIAMKLETVWGLGRSGLLWLPTESARDLALYPEVRVAVRDTLDRAYSTAMKMLAANRRPLDALAEALFKRGYLDRAEIRAVLETAPIKSRDVDETVPSHSAPSVQ
jgi:cell division protease FtsH